MYYVNIYILLVYRFHFINFLSLAPTKQKSNNKQTQPPPAKQPASSKPAKETKETKETNTKPQKQQNQQPQQQKQQNNNVNNNLQNSLPSEILPNNHNHNNHTETAEPENDSFQVYTNENRYNLLYFFIALEIF